MSFVAIIVALVLAFIAYKVLMGIARVSVILLIVVVLGVLWSQGMIA